MIGILLFPLVLYVLFDKWSDSIARQIIGISGMLGIFILATVKQKQNALVLVFMFSTQFILSFFSFDIDPPVKVTFLLSDVIFIILLMCFLEIRERIKFDLYSVVLLSLVLWQFSLMFLSAHFDRSLLFVAWQIKLLIIYLIIRNIDFKDKFYQMVPWVISGVVVVQAIITIAQYLKGGYVGMLLLGERNPDMSAQFFVNDLLRASGTLGATNAMGGYFAMLLVFLLPFAISKRSILLYGIFLLGLIGLYIPLSRAGWLSFLVGSALLGLQLLRRRLVKPGHLITMGSFALLLVVVVFAVNQEQIMNRFEDKNALASAEGRVGQIPEAWDVTMRRPISGIGPGVTSMFGAWNDHIKYIRDKLPDLRLQNQFHNSILQTMVESGIIGGLLFILLILIVLLRVFKRYSRDDEYAVFKLACSVSALVYLIDTQFGPEINNYQMMGLYTSFFALSNNKYINNIVSKKAS
jgi:O-antigen ligase